MRIRTQFLLAMIAFGVTAAVIGMSAWTAVQEMSHLGQELDTVTAIGGGAAELAYLSGDYLFYREDQQRQRWESKWTSVARDVERLTPATTQERTIKAHLKTDLDRMKAVFDDVAEAPVTLGTDRGLAAEGLLQVYWSRLAIQNQNTAFEVLTLSRVLRERHADVSRSNALLMMATLSLFTIYLITNYVIVYRRALVSISALRAGTKVVGSGDLDYAIPVTRSDEIGELTRAFNRMTVDLKGVTASKTELEREVAEREKAQVALRNSLNRIQVLSDARERELEITKLLLDAARLLAGWTDLKHVLEGLADVVLSSTEHARVTIQLWDGGRRELQTVVVRGDAERHPIQQVVGWDEISGPGRDVIETMTSRVIDFDALPAEGRGGVARPGARLGLVVPLVYRGRLVGVVGVDDPGERRDFVDAETALIEGLAAQAAVAIENSRMYEDERRVADALRSVFQRTAPVIEGLDLCVVGDYASEADRVGGDFFDAFEVGNQVAVLVGDVAGKGVAAVGLTERVRSTVRALAYGGEALSPGNLLGRANESLVRQVRPGEFVTAVLLVIDRTTRAYRFARAGHPHPVICGKECRQLEIPSGPPLGVFLGEYQEVSQVLAPHETLLLYTDGVTEARRDNEFFGEARVLESLAKRSSEPEELAEGLFTDVRQYARGRLADDLLILALRLSQ